MYDVRFKGFGYNKQLQILQLVQQHRFRLMVCLLGGKEHVGSMCVQIKMSCSEPS